MGLPMCATSPSIVGTAREHARIDGRYVDAIIVERFLDDAVME